MMESTSRIEYLPQHHLSVMIAFGECDMGVLAKSYRDVLLAHFTFKPSRAKTRHQIHLNHYKITSGDGLQDSRRAF
jgi:hypothetical protein